MASTKPPPHRLAPECFHPLLILSREMFALFFSGSMPHLRIYFHTFPIIVLNVLPCWLSSKESTCNAGDAIDAGLIPESGRSPGGGNGNPLQYSCRENPMDRGAWWATVHRVTKSWTRLNTHMRHFSIFLYLVPRVV